MAQLIRNDGVGFVVLTYRELLTAARPSILKREINLLATENGPYVKCFQREQGVEAIFSKDTGYLLAESVWDYFKQPDNLIYGEELPNGNVVLVVIRGGIVFLDTEVSMRNLMAELMGLALGSTAYTIKLCGDLPIGEGSAQFQFPTQNVESEEHLESSVFLQLKTNEEYRLGTVKEAFASLGYTGMAIKVVIIIALLAVLAFLAWLIFKPAAAPAPPPAEVVAAAPAQPPPDPYADFKQALMTPAPDALLQDLVNTLNDVYTIPGWTPQSLTLAGSSATVNLVKNGGNAGILLAWKRSHPDVQMTINTGQVVLTYGLQLTNRPTPEVIYKLPDLLANFYDDLNAKLPSSTVSVGPMTRKGVYQQSSIGITFTNQSPDSLMVLANELKGLPAVLSAATMRTSGGLISGQLTIDLIGA
ncbi:MAG: hypothetical protein K0R48_1322 [Gammaproteobacteria bacterium]|jgi:hypothetical protein|nr:hypothetical protein [Gammaproteobacteria bacterium]